MANQKVSIEFDVNVDPLSDIIAKKAEEELVKKLVGMAETIVFDHKGYGYGNLIIRRVGVASMSL